MKQYTSSGKHISIIIFCSIMYYPKTNYFKHFAMFYAIIIMFQKSVINCFFAIIFTPGLGYWTRLYNFKNNV